MYYGGGNQTTVNNNSKPLPFDFVTGSVKGRTDGFTIKVRAVTAHLAAGALYLRLSLFLPLDVIHSAAA